MTRCDIKGKLTMKAVTPSSKMLMNFRKSLCSSFKNSDANQPNEMFLSVNSWKRSKMLGTRQKMNDKIVSERRVLNSALSGRCRIFFSSRFFFILIWI